jgi:hypothetical protein
MNAAPVAGSSSATAASSPLVIEHATELASRIRKRIWEARTAEDLRYRIAGKTLSFRFLDPRVKEQLSPAFHHLSTHQLNPPDLTVFLDGAMSCSTDLPRVMEWDGWGERDVWVVKVAEMMLIIQSNAQIVGALDCLNNTGYWLDIHERGVNYLERTAPMLPLLTFWFGSMGQFLCHGAAVGSDNGGVLIVGAGGAGKTTTALACLEAGMKYLGDDRCLLSMGEFPHIHSLYGTAKLADITRFPEFEAVIDTNGKQSEEKSLYHLHRLPRSGLHAGFPLRAILMARIENRQETTISSASEARAFLALAASGALHMPEMRKNALRIFDSAARRLPVYDLRLGRNIRSTPDVIRQLLCELS